MATTNKLSDRYIKTAQQGIHTDGQGLYLEVTPAGNKVWRFRAKGVAHTKSGKILLTLGRYPEITLAKAREIRAEIRGQIAQGLDPREVARQKEQAERLRRGNTLETIAAEWLAVRTDKVTEKTIKSTDSLLRRYVFPLIGDRPITDITPQDVMAVLRNAEKHTAIQAKAIKGLLTRIFSYAIQTGIANSNPAAAMVTSDVLRKHTVTHYKAISIEELPDFLKAIDADDAGIQVKSAMKLSMMLFMRKGELRYAEWSHIDLNAATWTIPADNTKKRREQVYPLPKQAIAILKKLHVVTGHRRYVFATYARGKDAPLGDNAINNAISRMGYHKRMTVHGFRALAASWLDERGYNRLAIERQLSHLEQGQTNQAYHRADYMDERRTMLQDWADYLTSIQAKNKGLRLIA